MITTETPLKEFYNYPELSPVMPYLLGNGEPLFQIPGLTLKVLEAKQPTWNANDMVYGCNRLLNLLHTHTVLYLVYSDSEIAQDSSKKDVCIFHFPANNPDGRFAIITAGGGYGCVCSLVEGFPVAARLNELGITAFVLNYRVCHGTTDSALFPKPLDDLAAAYQFISAHATEFHINPTHYSLCGFSAGGHLAAAWGTEKIGARSYFLAQPEFLMLAYPLITTKNYLSKGYDPALFDGMFGKNYTDTQIHPYLVDQNIDYEYPPCFVIQCKDDNTVPIEDSKDFTLALNNQHIPFTYETPLTGGHGFGLGSNGLTNGWIERALNKWI